MIRSEYMINEDHSFCFELFVFKNQEKLYCEIKCQLHRDYCNFAKLIVLFFKPMFLKSAPFQAYAFLGFHLFKLSPIQVFVFLGLCSGFYHSKSLSFQAFFFQVFALLSLRIFRLLCF